MLFRPKQPTEIVLYHLNEQVQQQRKHILQQLGSKFEVGQFLQKISKDAKAKKKEGKIFVLDFKGDMQASAVEYLREEITLLLSSANPEQDKIVVRLESAGGLVHGYGLASAQLLRLRDAGFHVTICIDKVAASGGYMMACIAHEIISAPFAIVGSIGVVAQIPNFNRLLKEHHVDFELFTAGEYKRTVTMFGENTDEGKQKFEQELQQTHELFKHFIEKYRPQLNIQQIATGEHWYGQDALNLNLVDKLATSDGHLFDLMQEYDIYLLHTRRKPTLGEKLGLHTSQIANEVLPVMFNHITEYLHRSQYNSMKIKK